MTLADYFQPLGLNFLQSPIQLHPSPPHPTPPLLSTRPQSFTNVWLLEEGAGWLFYGPREGSTRVPPFLFSPRASSRAGWQKNNNNNKLQLNSVNAEVRGGGMESVRVNRMSVD